MYNASRQDENVQTQGTLSSLNNCAIIVHTDTQGIILNVNEMFCKLSGFAREELIGENHRILNSGYHSSEFFKDLWTTILDGRIWTGEIQNRNKQGQVYWVHTVISPVKDYSGKIVEFIAVRFDITAQKKNEKIILKAKKQLKVAYESSGSGSWELNLQTQEMIVSDSFLKVMFGSNNQNIDTLENLLSFVLPEDRTFVKEKIEDSRIRQSSCSFDCRILQKVGDPEKWVNNVVDFIPSDPESFSSLLGIVVDISSKKQAEKTHLLLTSSSKMTSLGEMACGIIHEINNPIAIIMGRLAMVKFEMSENPLPSTEFYRDSFKTIESAVHRMARITQGLRSYARNSTSDPMARIQLSQIPKQVEEICRDNFRLNSINLEIDLSEIEDVFILGRSDQLLQVFLNLISNALDAVKGTSNPWVKVQGIRFAASVVINVSDSGQGIPPEIAARIMQPFFSTKKPGEGTGLGLSISKGIVEEHRGTLSYDASSSHTSFIVEFPIL